MRQKDPLVEDGVDGDEPAGTEKDFLGTHDRVPTGPEDVDETIRCDGVGDPLRCGGDGVGLLVCDPVHEVEDRVEVSAGCVQDMPPVQPLRPERATPSMILRRRARTTMRMGRTLMTDPADTAPKSTV